MDSSKFARSVVVFLWLFTLSFGAYVYFDLSPASRKQKPLPAQKPLGPSANSDRAESRVNRYLQDLNLRLETQKVISQDDLEKAKMEINHQLAEEVARGQSQKNSVRPQPEETPQIDRDEQLAERDLYSAHAYVDTSPGAEIQRDIARTNEANHERANLNQAYVNEFIENARKQGYEVDVDDKFQVTSIRKLTRNPSGSSSASTVPGGRATTSSSGGGTTSTPVGDSSGTH